MTYSFPRRISALEQIVSILNDWISRLKIDQKTAYGLHLTVEEVFTNLVKYNTTATADIQMQIERQDREIIIQFRDFDVEDFDISKTPDVDPMAPLEQRRAGGLGLFLVHRVMDRVEYHYENKTRMSTITLAKTISEDLC